MRNTLQTLGTAIGELNCLRPDTPAALDELHALSIAHDCIDTLLRSCIEQMRHDPEALQSWADIAYTLGCDSANAVRQRFGSLTVGTDEQVVNFWEAHAERFAWDFLPSTFLHQLYTSWMRTNANSHMPLTNETFTRRLKTVATANGNWTHIRSRPDAHMSASEPLLTLVPGWLPPSGNRAIYGFRRTNT